MTTDCKCILIIGDDTDAEANILHRAGHGVIQSALRDNTWQGSLKDVDVVVAVDAYNGDARVWWIAGYVSGRTGCPAIAVSTLKTVPFGWIHVSQSGLAEAVDKSRFAEPPRRRIIDARRAIDDAIREAERAIGVAHRIAGDALDELLDGEGGK